jgi:hypothetical protein
MAKFISDYLCGCYNPDGRRFKLSQPFFYQTDVNPRDFGYDTKGIRIDNNNNFWIDIPAGFVTDFASVPQIFWSIIPPTGTKTRAAVIHDYLYTAHPQGRPWADKVFLEAMKVGQNIDDFFAELIGDENVKNLENIKLKAKLANKSSKKRRFNT